MAPIAAANLAGRGLLRCLHDRPCAHATCGFSQSVSLDRSVRTPPGAGLTAPAPRGAARAGTDGELQLSSWQRGTALRRVCARLGREVTHPPGAKSCNHVRGALQPTGPPPGPQKRPSRPLAPKSTTVTACRSVAQPLCAAVAVRALCLPRRAATTALHPAAGLPPLRVQRRCRSGCFWSSFSGPRLAPELLASDPSIERGETVRSRTSA